MDKNIAPPQTSFLPDFCRVEAVLYILLMAQILAIILALNSYALNGEFWLALALNGLFILWVTLLSASILCALKKTTATWPAVLAGFFAFCIINTSTAFITWLSDQVFAQLALEHLSKSANYLSNLAISSIVSGLILRYLYVTQAWRNKTKAASEAKLDALQARMRPHFLFNSLNSIASLTREDPALAETLTEDLADLFRASMQASGRMVPFEQECALTQQYLNIEKTRLGERLNIQWDIKDIPSDALLPPISLQPLVENAVYHGIEPAHGKNTLAIKGKLRGKLIIISVQNPVIESRPARKGNHIAFTNLRLRLQSCFASNSSLTLSSAEGIVTARLQFPYQTQQS